MCILSLTTTRLPGAGEDPARVCRHHEHLSRAPGLLQSCENCPAFVFYVTEKTSSSRAGCRPPRSHQAPLARPTPPHRGPWAGGRRVSRSPRGTLHGDEDTTPRKHPASHDGSVLRRLDGISTRRTGLLWGQPCARTAGVQHSCTQGQDGDAVRRLRLSEQRVHASTACRQTRSKAVRTPRDTTPSPAMMAPPHGQASKHKARKAVSDVQSLSAFLAHAPTKPLEDASAPPKEENRETRCWSRGT